MNSRAQKYLQKGENDHPSLGELVHWHILDKKLKKNEIAKSLNVQPNTLNMYFKKGSMQFGILWRLSQAINENLVMKLGELLNIPFETKVENELRKQITDKDEQIKALEMELAIYKRIIEK